MKRKWSYTALNVILYENIFQLCLIPVNRCFVIIASKIILSIISKLKENLNKTIGIFLRTLAGETQACNLCFKTSLGL